MTVNHKVTGTAASMPVGLTLGALCCMILTVLGAAVSAHLISNETIQETSIGYCAMVILLVSSFTGAAIAAGRIKRRRLMVCALIGGLYYSTLLGMTALFFGGQYQGMGVTALLVLCGCGLAVMLGFRKKRTGPGRSRKIGHR